MDDGPAALTFADFLTGAPVIADGALGTLLLDRGLRLGDCAELWNILPERRGIVRAIHRAYVEAGAQIVLTNTLGANPFRLGHAGLEQHLDAINRAGAALAREGAVAGVLVAGSVGPIGEVGDWGLGTGDWGMGMQGSVPDHREGSIVESITAGFARQATALAAGGVDLIWVETMGEVWQVRAAVVGAQRGAGGLPVVATLSFGDNGRTYAGATVEEAAEALHDLGLAAIGANCGDGPAATERAIAALRRALPSLPLVAKSNLGLPTIRDGHADYAITTEAFAAHARRVHALGASIIGGCCGSTPEHLAAAVQALR